VNSVLRIQVRVNSGPATAEIKAIQAAVVQMTAAVTKATMAMDAASKRAASTYNGMNTAAGKAASGVGRFGSQLGSVHQRLEKFGKNVQWSGRQIEYNFTLPILLAGAAAVKFALDQEKAFTRLKKVYGDQIGMTEALMKANEGWTEDQAGAEATRIFANEIKALDGALRALSDRFGVARAEVNGIAADWAAAGASGIALANGVKTSLEAMILGEMDAKKATEALIAVQAQYGLTSEELVQTLGILNSIENATGASLQGLVEGFQRSAAAARTAGVGVRELGAFIATLTPATGSATQAGNALKTIFSRILAPTAEAARILEAMGINVSSVGWQSKTAGERLMELASTFENLSSAQQAVVSSTLASRFQISRFDQIMRSLTGTNSYYYAAMKATSDQAQVMVQYYKELNAVLESNPRKFEIIKTRIQNLMADAIIPLLPSILGVMTMVVRLLKSFTDLNPQVQIIIMSLLLAVAAFGTFLRLAGAVAIFIGYLGGVFKFLAGAILWIPVTLGKAGLAFKGILSKYFIAPLRGLLMMYLGAMNKMIAATSAWVARMWAAMWTWAAGTTRASAVATLALVRTWASGLIVSLRLTVAWAVAQLRVVTTAMLGMVRRVAVSMAAIVLAMSQGWLAAIRVVGVILLGGSKAIITALLKIWRVGLVALGRMMVVGLTAIFSGPWGLAIAAAVLIFVAFREQIVKVLKNIIENMAQIIPAFGQIMRGLAQMLAGAIRKIRDILSYLNPFARHSPSLVDNVRAGMKVIAKEYASLSQVETAYAGLIAATVAFTKATKDAVEAIEAKARAEERALVVSQAGSAAGRAYDVLVASIKRATAELQKLEAAMMAQQAVVDLAEAALEGLDAQLDAATDKLQKLEDVASGIKEQMDAANQAIQDFASAPLVGLDALEDEIWANTVAQKKLQYAMMGIEDAIGPIDDVRNSLALMEGEIESLRGTQADMRNAGAGSDILSVYEEEIGKIEEQQDAVTDQMAAYSKLEDQLARLGREAEKLDLEKFLNFETLQHQIEELIDTREELTFEEITAGIAAEQARLISLTAQYDQAEAAVRDQKAVVEALTAARDAAKATYDAEKAKLDEIKSAYDAMSAAIKSAEDQLNQFVAAAEQAKAAADKLSPAEQNFADAAGGNWEDPGGTAGIGRDSFTDESALIDEFTNGVLDDIEKSFGNLDIFGPIKEAWNSAVQWLKDNIPTGVQEFVGTMMSNLGRTLTGAGIGAFIGSFFGPVGTVVGGILGAVFANLIPQEKLDAAKEKLGGWLDSLKERLSAAWEGIKSAANTAWRLLGAPIMEFGRTVWEFLKSLVDKIKEKFSTWGDIMEPLKGAITNIGNLFKLIGGIILGALRVILPIVTNTLKPVFDFIVTLVGSIIDIFHGIILFITGIFSGDLSAAWEGIKLIFSGALDAIWGLFKAIPGVLIGIVRGLIDGIIGLFTFLWDELVGHSIIPDMIMAIIDWFLSLPKKVIDAVWSLIQMLVSWAVEMMAKLLDAIVKAWPAILQFFIDLPGKIISAIAAFGQMLWDWITAAWGMFTTALGIAWDATWTWITELPGKFIEGLATLGEKLATLATEAWNWFWENSKTAWSTIWTWVSERPQAMWDGLMTLRDKVAQIATDAWNWFITRQKEGWTNIWTWLKERPAKTWEALMTLRDKVKQIAADAWNWFITRQKEGWTNIWTWLKERPAKTWEALMSLRDKVAAVARDAFQWFKDKAVEKWSAIMTWATGLPQKIANAFSGIKEKITSKVAGMWDGIKDAFKSALNWIIDKWNGLRIKIGGWKVDTIFGDFTFPTIDVGMPRIPRFATGGITNGPALVGEGRKRFPEFVIPTDPAYRGNALKLLAQATRAIGDVDKGQMLRKNAMNAAVRAKSQSGFVRTAKVENNTEIHFHGDLEFPNINSGEDAKEFIDNLKAIAAKAA